MQGNRFKVLMIDMDINLLEDMKRRFLLEPDFDSLVTTTSANEAGMIMSQLQPHIIVATNPLPDMDIVSFIGNINASMPQARVIVASEVDDPYSSSQCMQAGADYVINKPFSADKLIEVINTTNRRPKMNQNNQNSNNMPNFGQNPSFNQNQNGFGGNMFNQPQYHDQNMNGFGQNPYPQNQNPYQQNMGGMGMQQNYPQQPIYQQPQQMGQFPPPNFNHNQNGMPGAYQNMELYHGMTQEAIQSSQPNGFRTFKKTTFSVFSPKGGVGKSTLSKELAAAFASVSINGQKLKVLLFDCNIDFGNAASMLRKNPYPNLTNWVSDINQRLKENRNGPIRYSKQQIEQYLITHESGLKLLAAPASHADSLDVTGKIIDIVIENLKNCDFDVIVIDTGNNTKDTSLVALDKSDVILMPITLDLTTINDTKSFLDTARSIQFDTSKIKLVANEIPKNRDIDINEISITLKLPMVAVIPEYPKIRQLNNSGTPAVWEKESEYSMSVKKLANMIMPVFNKKMGGPSKQERGTKNSGGLFKKLFNK